MRALQEDASYKKIHKKKTSLIGQANKSKVEYLSADPSVGPYKGVSLVCLL